MSGRVLLKWSEHTLVVGCILDCSGLYVGVH